jgi:hypothetical protein
MFPWIASSLCSSNDESRDNANLVCRERFSIRLARPSSRKRLLIQNRVSHLQKARSAASGSKEFLDDHAPAPRRTLRFFSLLFFPVTSLFGPFSSTRAFTLKSLKDRRLRHRPGARLKRFCLLPGRNRENRPCPPRGMGRPACKGQARFSASPLRVQPCPPLQSDRIVLSGLRLAAESSVSSGVGHKKVRALFRNHDRRSICVS